jgi:hypothetical protein
MQSPGRHGVGFWVKKVGMQGLWEIESNYRIGKSVFGN